MEGVILWRAWRIMSGVEGAGAAQDVRPTGEDAKARSLAGGVKVGLGFGKTGEKLHVQLQMRMISARRGKQQAGAAL